MKITQAEDGLVLSKMLLCQLCGIPMNQEITLADEDKESLALSGTPVDTEQQRVAASDSAMNTRPELRMLQNTLDISKQATNLVRAVYLPHVALTGGYTISNPNVFNGFQKKFTGVWNVGVIVQVPVWNWFDGAYKVRAAKAASQHRPDQSRRYPRENPSPDCPKPVQGKGSTEEAQYGRSRTSTVPRRT